MAAAAAPQQQLVRGVAPEELARYQPVGGKFACFDGSKTIEFSQVNDNFCDCPDSSDEPGTSACPHGTFYCRNKGHEPRQLSTSFVDDGICDCCDGSDELSGCKNTCIEKNSAKRDALRAKIDAYRAALDKKAQYAASAKGVRANIKSRFAHVDQDIQQAERELERLTAARKAAEDANEAKKAEHQAAMVAKKAEADAKEAADKAAAEQAAADKAAAEQAAAAEAAAADAAAAAAAGGEAGEQPVAPDGEQPVAPDGEPGASAAAAEESDEERGRRIASQWTNDPAAAAAAAGPSAPAADEAAPTQPEGASEGVLGSLSKAWSSAKVSVTKLVGSAAGGTDAPAPAPAPSPAGEPDDELTPEQLDSYGSAYHDEAEGPAKEGIEAWAGYEPFDDSALRSAVSDLEGAERKLEELRAEKERVTRQVTYTFNDAWAGLLNTCLESKEPQFTYRFCFFDRAVQVDNGGGHETSLGRWKGFEAGGTEAMFDGGDFCLKAPARSLRVKLECGAEERAWGASEPSTCAYTAHASTPAACKQDTLAALEANMAALLAEEAALAREIAEEERQRQEQLASMREALPPHDEL